MRFRKIIDLEKCFAFLVDDKVRPPFRYHVEIFKDKKNAKLLLLYISLPQYHEAQLIYLLSKIAKLIVYDIDTTGRNSVSYAFYQDNYDFKNSKWKDSQEYIVEEPLSNI